MHGSLGEFFSKVHRDCSKEYFGVSKASCLSFESDEVRLVLEQKILMAEVATLYYEKRMTQQEIAEAMSLSRQTVSKLLNEAIRENIVEIKIHNPQKDCEDLRREICQRYSLRDCIICPSGSKSETLRYHMTVKTAAQYVAPILEQGGLKIAVSWGKTIHDLVLSMPELTTADNLVFPLFGATDDESYFFSSNELARGMADKIGAGIKYALFPYMADNLEDYSLLRKLSYYQRVQSLWETADLAIVGIGNQKVLEIFEKHFGQGANQVGAIGDIATHFFTAEGKLLEPYDYTLCASSDNLKKIKTTVAVACGNAKVQAISGALKTGLIDILITDECTVKQILG